MNRKQIEHSIANAYLHNKRENINTIYIDLVNMRAKLDRWFDKYLDMFDEKMNSVKRNDPLWKLYHTKSDEYNDVVQTIKTAQYYLEKP